MDAHDRLFFYTLLTGDTRPIRRNTIFQMVFVGIILAGLGVAFLKFYPHRGSTSQYPGTYSIVGPENRQVWTLKEEEFVDLINESLPDSFSSLTYLHEPKPYDSQRMLSSNGKTWLIIFDVVPDDAADNSLWQKGFPDLEEHLGGLTEVKLSLYQDETQNWSVNQQYVKALVGIFNPGAEDYVIRKLLLSGGATNASNIMVGNVSYTYASNGPTLIVEPDL